SPRPTLFFLLRPPPTHTLFPYTTLFRSQTGDPFASFLLGQVQASSQTIPVQPTFREAYTASWVNDEFKLNDRLTLTLGLRFDYRSEEHTSELQSRSDLVCRLLLEKKNNI